MTQLGKAELLMYIQCKCRVLFVLIFFVIILNTAFCKAEIEPTLDNVVKDVSELKDLYKKTIPIGASAPSFKLKDLSGKAFDSEEYLRKDLTLLYFWSAFCHYCKVALPRVDMIDQKFKSRGLKVIAINLDGIDFEDAVNRYLRENKIKLRQ